jgi:hypothetical protein
MGRIENAWTLRLPLNVRTWPIARTYVPGRHSASFWAHACGCGAAAERATAAQFTV